MSIEASLRVALEKATKRFVAEKKRSLRESNRDALDDQAIRRLREREAEQREKVTIKKAAWSVMKRAYLLASDNGRLPANMRQIMYAARPLVLKLTGASAGRRAAPSRRTYYRRTWRRTKPRPQDGT